MFSNSNNVKINIYNSLFYQNSVKNNGGVM